MPYADELNYWKPGKSSPDVWIDKAKKQIDTLGGKIRGEGFGSDGDGKAAFMLAFTIEESNFKIVWPVLPTYKGEEKAARVQAATSLYHYVKNVCLYAVVVGFRTAFFPHLLMNDGRRASQLATDELENLIPKLLQ